jgi:D-alanyl-lipoteichoic acid acyltransferase DltB (MBOAT superfamily)
MHDPTLLKLLLLLPPALIIYYLLPRRAQSFWLLGVSYLFYATWTWTFPLVLLLMTLGNFILGQEIKSSAHRRSLLVLGIVFNVALLGLAKYAGGLIDRMPDPLLARLLAALGLLGLPDQPDLLTILLPIGLSFRVLEMPIDRHRNDRLEPAADLVDFAVFRLLC